MSERRRIIWLNNDRFDEKPNKSAWIEISARFGEKGYKVCVVTGFGREKYTPEKAYPEMIYLPAINIPLIFRVTLMFSSLLWLLFKANRNDIIIINPDMLWVAPFLSLRGINNVHLDVRTLPLTQSRSLKKRADNWLFWTLPMKYLRGQARGYSFITRRLKTAIEEEFSTTFKNYEIWSSGVNTGRFKPAGNAPDSNEPFLLFYHGSIYAHRGLEEMVESVETLAEPYREKIRLIVVGTGGGLKNLKLISQSAAQPSIVEYKGFVPYEKIPAEISRADCCICPLPNYLQWNVSSPLKLLEYLACGKPAIITPIPAHTDALNKERFIVWTEGHQASDFQRAIIYAFENRKALRNEAADAPRFIASRYSWDILAERFIAYLEKTFPVVKTDGQPEAPAK